jgi:hypothetical protein
MKRSERGTWLIDKAPSIDRDEHKQIDKVLRMGQRLHAKAVREDGSDPLLIVRDLVHESSIDIAGLGGIIQLLRTGVTVGKSDHAGKESPANATFRSSMKR